MTSPTAYAPPRVDERPDKQTTDENKASEKAALNGASPSSSILTSDRLLSSDNLTEQDNVIVFGSAPLQPNSTVRNFASAMAEAMSALARIRAKTNEYDSEASANKLKAIISSMKAKIKSAKAAAEGALLNAQLSENIMKEIKRREAIMAALAILASILLAIITIVVSIFTAGLGAPAMIAASVGAVGAMAGGVIAGGLALSDALRTDGKSWFDGLADFFIGKVGTSNSAEKNSEIKRKREALRVAFSVIDAFFQAIFAIISFGASALTSATSMVVTKSIQMALRAIAEMIKANIAKFAIMMIGLVSNIALKIFSAMLESGSLARSLAGKKADSAIEDSLEEKMSARYEDMKNSSIFQQLVHKKGEAAAESELKSLIEKEKQAIIRGDVDAIVAIKEKLTTFSGNVVSESLKEQFRAEAADLITQGSIFAKDYYAQLIADTNSEYQNMTMGIMLALSVISAISAIASSAISMKYTPGGAAPASIEAKDAGKSALMAQNFTKGLQGAQFVLSIITGIVSTALSIEGAKTEHNNIEQQKQIKLIMHELRRRSLLKEFELFLLRLLLDSSFEIQKANLETFKHLGQVFADFWSTVASTFEIGLRTRL